MKKVINGKLYNTETADKICSWSNNYYPNDLHYYIERLYKKKKGEFFLHGEGGAFSKYSIGIWGGGSIAGEKIIPLTLQEAKDWVENYSSIEIYEKLFGEIEE